MNKKRIIVIVLGVVLVLSGVLYWFVTDHIGPNTPPENYSQRVLSPTATASRFTYQGVDGKDALTLLKQQTTVEQNGSGMVASIDGRKADDKKHEFWAFYINGKMATVGSAEYVTKSTDTIEWKIETY